jgi:hypothetical protein
MEAKLSCSEAPIALVDDAVLKTVLEDRASASSFWLYT